jgi:asparagine synthase (glutamine-hydrolysing)
MTIDGITLICNGEIYNYKELFEELDDVIPLTSSDCEIIIHLYKRYGMDYMLQLLDGVFAFVLYDSHNLSLYVARDPYGVRPLYMKTGENTPTNTTTKLIAFASELKVLNGLFGTEFNNKITHVLPSTYMSFTKKMAEGWILDAAPITYNTFKFYNVLGLPFKNDAFLPQNMYYNICHYLNAAVKKRVICDRPIACLLSGGLDSSLIAALVNKYYNGQLETYSIGMEGSEDLRNAEIVANYLGTKHTSIVMSEDDFFNAIPEVIESIESYDTTTVRASVGNYLIGKYIAQHSNAKVIFNGDGSDELTGGYLYFLAAPNDLEFDKECKRLLKNIYAFDVLRSDKCISSHGLEPRTPFLDRAWVDYYLSIPTGYRNPKSNYWVEVPTSEKHLLRTAFASIEPSLLPASILWRTKEAFSDGVSSTHKSWFEVIRDRLEINPNINMNMLNKEMVNKPMTKEQSYYRSIYDTAYPNIASIVPYFWMPRFVEASDASARTLKIYKQ